MKNNIFFMAWLSAGRRKSCVEFLEGNNLLIIKMN